MRSSDGRFLALIPRIENQKHRAWRYSFTTLVVRGTSNNPPPGSFSISLECGNTLGSNSFRCIRDGELFDNVRNDRFVLIKPA